MPLPPFGHKVSTVEGNMPHIDLKTAIVSACAAGMLAASAIAAAQTPPGEPASAPSRAEAATSAATTAE